MLHYLLKVSRALLNYRLFMASISPQEIELHGVPCMESYAPVINPLHQRPSLLGAVSWDLQSRKF